jgi:hypothetical protein
VVGDGLRLVAWSPEDGVKEAVEGTSPDQFVLGVQWHPERTYDSEPASRAMFRAFVQAAADWHRQLADKQQDFESVERKSCSHSEQELFHHGSTERTEKSEIV